MTDFYSSIFEYFCQTNKDQNLNITMTDDVMVRDEDLLQSCFPIFQLNGPTLYSRMWSLGAPISDLKLIHENKFQNYLFVQIYLLEQIAYIRESCQVPFQFSI